MHLVLAELKHLQGMSEAIHAHSLLSVSCRAAYVHRASYCMEIQTSVACHAGLSNLSLPILGFSNQHTIPGNLFETEITTDAF